MRGHCRTQRLQSGGGRWRRPCEGGVDGALAGGVQAVHGEWTAAGPRPVQGTASCTDAFTFHRLILSALHVAAALTTLHCAALTRTAPSKLLHACSPPHPPPPLLPDPRSSTLLAPPLPLLLPSLFFQRCPQLSCCSSLRCARWCPAPRWARRPPTPLEEGTPPPASARSAPVVTTDAT